MPQLGRVADYLLLGGLFLIPFIPLFAFDSLVFPSTTGKAFAFYVLVELLLLLYLVRLFLPGRKEYPTFSWVSISFLLFVLIAGIANILGIDPAKSIFSTLVRSDGFYGLLHLFAFFILLITYFRKESFWRAFFTISAGVSGVISLTAVAEWLAIDVTTIDTRADSFFGNPVFLGIYALFHIWIAAFLFIRQAQSVYTRILFACILLLNLATLILSGTRGALLGLLGGLCVAFVFFILKTAIITRKQKIAGLCVFITITAVGMWGVIEHREHFGEVPMIGRLLLLTPETITEQPRYFMWKAALKGFLERPLLGWGQEQFNLVYQKYYDPHIRAETNVVIGEYWSDRVHNMYLEWLVAGGVLGLLGYLFLLGAAFYSTWKTRALSLLEQSTLFGFFSAYSVNNLFAFDILPSLIIVIAVLGYLHYTSYELKPFLNFHFVRKLIPALFLVVTLPIIYFTIAGIQTAQNVAEVLREEEITEEHIMRISEFLKSEIYIPSDFPYLLANRTAWILENKVTDGVMKDKLVSTFDHYYVTHIQTKDADARNHYIFGHFYSIAGATEKALHAIRNATALSPQNQTYLLLESALLQETGDYPGSLERAKYAYVLEPYSSPSLAAFAVALIYNGEIVKAEELLKERYGTYKIEDKEIISAYIFQEQWEKALELLEMHIEKTPMDIGFHISRITIFLKLGDEIRALEAADEFIKIDESHEALGREMIGKIEQGEYVTDL